MERSKFHCSDIVLLPHYSPGASDALSGRVVWYRVYPGLKHLGYSVWPLRGDLPSSLLTLAPSAVVKSVRTPHPSELRRSPQLKPLQIRTPLEQRHAGGQPDDDTGAATRCSANF